MRNNLHLLPRPESALACRIRIRITSSLGILRAIEPLQRMPRLRSNLAQLLPYVTFELDANPANESSHWRCDMKRKGLVLSVCLVLLLVLTTVDVQARGCRNPVFLPFAVAGAVVGTVVGSVAAITTAVVPAPGYAYHDPYYAPAPGYYRPHYPRPDWIPGHYNRYGYWIPGHWR
jgi:hypothetical protein